MLVGTVQRRSNLDGCALHFHRVGIQTPGLLMRAQRRHVGNRTHPADIQLGGNFAKSLIRLRVLRQRDQCAAMPKDPSLLVGDGANGRAQPLSVVQRNVGHDGEQRVNDVGGVEPSAHTYFENGHIDLTLGKVEEGHGGQRLKVAGQLCQGQRLAFAAGQHQLLRAIHHTEVEPRKIRVGNLGAVHANALVGPHQVRRGVEPGAQTGGLQNGSERGRGGALAIGSCN